ncbi:Casein kinase I isoform alpha [Orchesella cincta]|uniref:Casein kinase I isoform alpha n=1 Tax=Orchesella cincta TaxID=48709 RepID=A0A1D2MK58_ORCCI|nr:Casein kinase I isoform alpha [Orchesella cincta]
MAVKVERGRGAHSLLMYETSVYSRLEGVAGFPEMKWCLNDSEQGHCMMGVEPWPFPGVIPVLHSMLINIKLYMTDFGISMQYFDEKSQKHILPRQTGKLVGSLKFSSLNSHLGQKMSRVKGATRKQTFDKIWETTWSTSAESFVMGSLFWEFICILKYCAKLEFEQASSYSMFRVFLQVRAKKENIEFDNVFDWTQSP